MRFAILRLCPIVGLVVAVVTGCSSSGPTPATATRTSSGPASGRSADPTADLFGRLQGAAATTHTVHVVENLTATKLETGGNLDFDATGDIVLSGGKVTSADLKISPGDAGGQTAEAIVDGTSIYLRQTGHNGPGGKPWVEFGPQTPTDYKAIYLAANSLLALAAPASTIGFRSGATEVRKRLPTTEAGVAVTPFAMTVELAKTSPLPPHLATFADPKGSLEVTVDVDTSGRLATLSEYQSETPTRTFDSSVTYSRYESTVSIAAPPASQVSG